MKLIVIISSFLVTICGASAPSIHNFSYSKCIGEFSNDSITSVQVLRKDNFVTIDFGALAPCNGNLKASVLQVNDTLHLTFEPKPTIIIDKEGVVHEIIEVADCDCFFRFSYVINKTKSFDSNLIFANNESIYKLSKLTSEIQEEVEREIEENSTIEDVIYQEAPLTDENGVYDIVEVQPSPRGGMKFFNQYLIDHLEYPEKARKDGIEGRVYVQFIVDLQGELIQVEVIKGINEGLNQEAIRLIKSAPRFTAGRQNGAAVKTRMVIPVTFKLPNGL